MRYIAGICGHFGFGLDLVNGQTIKTKIIAEELARTFGDEQIKCMDTHGGALAVPRMAWQLLRLFMQCGQIILLPAHKGVRLFMPLCCLYRLFFKRKLRYVVIGGWLGDYLGKHYLLKRFLRHFEAIYVETNNMRLALESKGLQNIKVMPNCKRLTIARREAPKLAGEPYRLCTFSRVMYEKGIEDAVLAVRDVNTRLGREAFTLDIFGPIDKAYQQRFDALRADFPPFIRYGGIINYNQSGQTLQNYFALLFPTRFAQTDRFNEGHPGTIIDAYAAGLPVISSRWDSFSDVIKEGETGFGYESGDCKALSDILEKITVTPAVIDEMRPACLRAAEEFLPEKALRVLMLDIEEADVKP